MKVSGWGVQDLGNGRAEVTVSWDGMRNASIAVEPDELRQMMVDLAEAYYRITGALPPPVRRADVGAASRTGPTPGARLRTIAGSKAHNAKRKERR